MSEIQSGELLVITSSGDEDYEIEGVVEVLRAFDISAEERDFIADQTSFVHDRIEYYGPSLIKWLCGRGLAEQLVWREVNLGKRIDVKPAGAWR